MTFEERRALKEAVSAARRERVTQEMIALNICAHCEEPFVVTRQVKGGRPQRFCSNRCRSTYWSESPKVRAVKNAKRRKQREAA